MARVVLKCLLLRSWKRKFRVFCQSRHPQALCWTWRIKPNLQQYPPIYGRASPLIFCMKVCNVKILCQAHCLMWNRSISSVPYYHLWPISIIILGKTLSLSLQILLLFPQFVVSSFISSNTFLTDVTPKCPHSVSEVMSRIHTKPEATTMCRSRHFWAPLQNSEKRFLVS